MGIIIVFLQLGWINRFYQYYRGYLDGPYILPLCREVLGWRLLLYFYCYRRVIAGIQGFSKVKCAWDILR